MGHFAKVIDGIVEAVIVAEQSDIDSLRHGDPSLWVQTSYNTKGGVHYNPETQQPDGGIALRYNYAMVGGIYDKDADAFYIPKPSIYHELDTNEYVWKNTIPKPAVPPGGMDYWCFDYDNGTWDYTEPGIEP
jgi:hypothetical protein